MGMCNFSVITLIALLSVYVNADDWFALMNANYAAIQSGLAKLNNASTALDRSMNQQQQAIQDAFNGVALHLNESLVAIRVTHPDLALTSNQISPAAFAVYLNSNLNRFRQTVTDGVMIPAQAIVNGVLETMYNFYDRSPNSYCVQQSAASLVQPRISVGRLADCILEDVPFFARLARLVDKVLSSITTMIDAGVAQQDYCSTGSVNCTSVFKEALSIELDGVVGALGKLQSITTYYSNPGQSINRACADVVTTDIQDAIQQVKDRVALCG